MKKHLVIFLALLFALSSCDSDLHRAKRYYQQAKEVAASDPDSALILIDSVLNIMVFLDDDIRMNMSLMQAEALFTHPDGERRELSQRIKAKKIYTTPELERSAEYFAGKGNYLRASYGALYSGYVLRELRDDDAAMVCFKDAAKYAELTGDSLTYARTQKNVAHILMDCHVFKDAVPILESAYSYSGSNFDDKANLLNMMSVAYMMQNDYIKAEECLKQSMMYASKTASLKTKWSIMNNYSVFYRKQELFSQAITCLKNIEHETDSTKLLKLYLNLGLTLVQNKDNESAAVYFRKIDSLLQTKNHNVKPETMVSAYAALSYFAELKNDCQLSLDYHKKYAKLQDNVQDTLRNKKIYHIQRKYDYETLQNTMNRRIISNYRIEMMMAVVIIIVLAAALVLYYRIIQKNKIDAENKAKLLHYMLINKDLAEKYNSTEKMNQENVKMLFEAWNKEEMTMIKLAVFDKNKSDKALINELKLFVFDKKESWDAMMGVVDKLYPGLRETIAQKYPDLNDDEKKDYILSFFNVSRQEEADLLGISISVVDKLRNKTRKKINATEL